MACPSFSSHFAAVFSFVKDAREQGYLNSFPSMIRISFGLSGILLRCSDIDAFISFARRHMKEGPIDSLLGEFWGKTSEEGVYYFQERLPLVYRYNLLDHLGYLSTRDPSHETMFSYPGCYNPLFTSSLMSNENFNFNYCSKYIFSPCYWLEGIKDPAWQFHSLAENHLVPPKPINIPLNILKIGEEGQSCNEVCPKGCAEFLLERINTCNEVERVFECNGGCKVDGMVHLEVVGPGIFNQDCLVSSLTGIECEAKRPLFRRLCPCISSS